MAATLHTTEAAGGPAVAVDDGAVQPPTSTSKKSVSVAEGAALALGIVLVQVFTMVTLLLSELVLGAGTRPLVLLVYRNLIGAAAVVPLALLLERGMMKKINAVVCGWISINAMFGVVLATGMYYYGLHNTNVVYSANFLNLILTVTFIIAIILRAEKLAIRTWPSRMMLLGTAMCVGGTMVVSLFRGELLHLWPTNLLRLTKLAKVFPSKYWATVLTCLSGSLQAFVVGVLTAGGDWWEWKLSWDLRLLTVAYSGVFNTGITFVLILWAIRRRGPIYPSMFNSLLLIITTVMGSMRAAWHQRLLRKRVWDAVDHRGALRVPVGKKGRSCS